MEQPDLVSLAKAFRGNFDLVPNPAPPVILDTFCETLQANGEDLSQWEEGDWYAAFEALGYAPDRGMILIEQVASWGVTDVDTFIDPASAALVEEATRGR
jgi:hypothetical protein